MPPRTAKPPATAPSAQPAEALPAIGPGGTRRPGRLYHVAVLALCGAACAGGGASLTGLPIPGWALWTLLGLVVGTVALGVARAELGLFSRPITRFDGPPGCVALTFDDGPDPVETPAILDLLEARGHRATFFLIGARASQYPDLVRRIAGQGHTIGNHSYHHYPWTAALPVRQLANELATASQLLERLGGRPVRWVRAPVGLLSPPVANAIAATPLVTVHWTATARDGVRWAQPARCLARLRRALVPGAILVLHDGVTGPTGSVARQILPVLLDDLDARGLRSVSLDAMAAATGTGLEGADAGSPA